MVLVKILGFCFLIGLVLSPPIPKPDSALAVSNSLQGESDKYDYSDTSLHYSLATCYCDIAKYGNKCPPADPNNPPPHACTACGQDINNYVQTYFSVSNARLMGGSDSSMCGKCIRITGISDNIDGKSITSVDIPVNIQDVLMDDQVGSITLGDLQYPHDFDLAFPIFSRGGANNCDLGQGGAVVVTWHFDPTCDMQNSRDPVCA